MADKNESERVREARALRVLLRAVGDLVRLQILYKLARQEEMSVTALARTLRVSQPLVSWHLGILRRARLVNVRKEGRLVWHSLNREEWRSFLRRLDAWIGVEKTEGEDYVQER